MFKIKVINLWNSPLFFTHSKVYDLFIDLLVRLGFLVFKLKIYLFLKKIKKFISLKVSI